MHVGGTWLSRELTGRLVEAMYTPMTGAKRPVEEITARGSDALRLIVAQRTPPRSPPSWASP